MSLIVFYSWQSDLPNSTNRGFIEKALENAIKTISNDENIVGGLVIDRDTLGVPGAPDIANTIFNKIEQSHIFVCDVSIINSGSAFRPVPNPNVLIELGYAIKTLTADRIIMVFNTAFGDLNQLPFDLGLKRIITYEVAEAKEDKALLRKELERKIESGIRIILEELLANQVPNINLQFANTDLHLEMGNDVEVECVVIDLPRMSQIPSVPGEGLLYSLVENNTDYYREFAQYTFLTSILQPIGFALKNTGPRLLVNVHLEIIKPMEDKLLIIGERNYPEQPQYKKSRFDLNFPDIAGDDPVTVNQRGNNWEISVDFGNIQPKATAWVGTFFIGSPETRTVEFEALIYEDYLPEPLRIPLTVSIKTRHQPITVEKLIAIADEAS